MAVRTGGYILPDPFDRRLRSRGQRELAIEAAAENSRHAPVRTAPAVSQAVTRGSTEMVIGATKGRFG